jgi:type II secretion system protein N
MGRLARVATVAALLVVLVGLMLPTNRLVHTLLARVPLPPDRLITFRGAQLRPWGLVLDDVAYRRSDGEPLLETDWVRLRPSWTALWHDRLGRPWHVSAGILGGTVDARIDAGRGDRTLDTTWTGIDVGLLLDALERGDPLSGLASGHAAVRLPADGDASGAGALAFRDASWRPPLDALGEVTLHADTAALQWTLGERRLEIVSAEVRGRELDLDAHGRIDVARDLGASALHLDVVVSPLPGAPRPLRRLLDGLPRRADGSVALRVTGTLDAPRTAAP